MSFESVISCPHCLRQYAVALDATHAQCSACKSHFAISRATLADGGEGLVLDRPIEPRSSFFREGCAELARNVRAALELAGEPVTPERVWSFIDSMPRSPHQLTDEAWRGGVCNTMLKEAYCRTKSDGDGAAIRALLDYFFDYIPGRDPFCQDMLRAAFLGVMGGLDIQFEAVGVPPSRRASEWTVISIAIAAARRLARVIGGREAARG